MAAVGCAARKAAIPDRVPEGATRVAYAPIPEASDPRWPGFDRPMERLVRDAAEWGDLWRSLTRGSVPIPAVPPVDFHEQVVVLLVAPPGREIEVAGAWRAGDRLFVEMVETGPGPSCPAVTSGEAAVAAIRLDRWPGIEGRFLGRIVTRNCP